MFHVLLKLLPWTDLKYQRRAYSIFGIFSVIQQKAAGIKCPFYCRNTLIKAGLRNLSNTEQRPADETAAQALKYNLPKYTEN